MSLISSVQLANNSLRANQIGLQVVGQNIANANTPGYIREEVLFTPGGAQRVGGLLLGMGVEVSGVVQKIDKFLEERLRGATSDRTSSETQEQTYLQLEGLIGELSDTDLSTALTSFFSSIQEVLNQPESVSVRNLAVLEGRTLAGDIGRLADRVTSLRVDQNTRIQSMAGDVNRLTAEIQRLNIQISETEGSDITGSDAVGLRDQRGNALSALAKLVNVRVDEQADSGVNVFLGGDFLVFGGTRREVEVQLDKDRGLTVASLHLSETDSPLEATSGELAGLLVSRDEILGGFIDDLNEFAGALIFEFNKIFSSGQGLTGYRSLTSQVSVDSINQPLNAAGLPFTPVNGSFQVQVYNRQTGLTRTTNVAVDLTGDDDDLTLEDLRAALDDIDGITATISPTRNLVIQSESQNQDIAFANDNSGLLAALGLNTFFVGQDAYSIDVNQVLIDDPSKFAASRTGIGADTTNAIDLANFYDLPLTGREGTTLNVLYERLTAETAQASGVAVAVAEGYRVFEQALTGQHLALTGVSLDEEAVRMITYQKAFQASARFIATLTELLDILVSL